MLTNIFEVIFYICQSIIAHFFGSYFLYLFLDHQYPITVEYKPDDQCSKSITKHLSR